MGVLPWSNRSWISLRSELRMRPNARIPGRLAAPAWVRVCSLRGCEGRTPPDGLFLSAVRTCPSCKRSMDRVEALRKEDSNHLRAWSESSLSASNVYRQNAANVQDGIFSDERKMVLHQESQGGGSLLAAHLTDFASMRTAWRWRRTARRQLPSTRGLVFAKAMQFIGSGKRAGFAGGVPAAGYQVLLTAWRRKIDFEVFLCQPLAQRLASESRHSWWSLFEVISARGSYNGAKPLLGSTHPDPGQPFAAVTLGRTQPRSLLRFLRESARLGPFVREARAS